MDKQSNTEEAFIKKSVQEAGLLKPDPGFSQRVMAAVAQKSIAKTVYRPLITKPIWALLGCMVAACIAILFFLPTEGISLFDRWGWAKLSAIEFSMPTLDLSQTVTYAIGFLVLFLVQIPFLKRSFILRG
ncbi:hypothetical protein [Altibacter sp.]|uniref:hypothetical protein n=1 Tax=Altibacter sp. TaxID=2024823 RepID=UPI000C96E06A|nr:hypothetical protein [Altibacter sp.]MAP54549.1 hypothetical protein [Altibacter sp.]